MTARMCLMALAVLAFLPGSSVGGQRVEFVDREYGFALSLPADWTVAEEETDVIAIYGLPVLKFYEMITAGETAFIHLFFLDNPDQLPLDEFLTEPREGGIVVIERHLETIGGMNLLQVGYEYDPPFLGVFAVEVLHLVQRKPSSFVYLQFIAVVGVDYLDLLQEIVGSMAMAVPNRSMTLGLLKQLYR